MVEGCQEPSEASGVETAEYTLRREVEILGEVTNAPE